MRTTVIDRARALSARVLICGVSTRAAAESAARAGFSVTTIDGFADLDQHPSVRALSLPRDFGMPSTAEAGARAARTIECDTVAYLSSFENHPRAVATLAHGRALWGNAPEVLRLVRDPFPVAAALRRRGFAVPEVVRGAADASTEWMSKPLRSGGGQRVRRWRGRPVARAAYLQERIEGIPGSVVFAAAGGRVVPLGVSRQLIGDPAFGAAGYRYCGSILTGGGGGGQFSSTLVHRACALASAAGEEFGLVGVNGIDFIVRDHVPYAIEINPRWTASMELVERRDGLSVFGAHAGACARGELPAFDLAAAAREAGAVGKAIVFARRDLTVGDTRSWLGDTTVRDVPLPGERLTAGQPICTVLADAPDARSCYDALVRRAGDVYAEIAERATA